MRIVISGQLGAPRSSVESPHLVPQTIADLSIRNQALVLNADLTARYGKQSGTAFAAIVAGPNKVMRRVAHRDLITWDADLRGYRMDPADAEIVLLRWSAAQQVEERT